MKKLFSLTVLFSVMIIGLASAKASVTYEEAMNLSQPAAILVYADWADDAQRTLTAFNALEQQYGDKFNFVPMNIADKTTKPFNDKYHIYPKLPYMLLFKDGGKFSRYIQKDCILNTSCVKEKISLFVN